MNLQRLIDSIKKHEGHSPYLYKDSENVETIGYGFAIRHLTLEVDVSSIILERKILHLVVDCYTLFPWLSSMPALVQETIIEMAYQIGLHGLSKFVKTISYLKSNDWDKASEEMLNSKWASQSINRAKELSNRIASLEDGNRDG